MLTLSSAARSLLGRMLRSSAAWRVSSLPAADRPAMLDLVAGGLIEQQAGVYRLTAAGRLPLPAAGLPSGE